MPQPPPPRRACPPECPGAVHVLWTQAKAAYRTGAFPLYAGPEWCGLRPDDPQRLASVLAAAESWRRHQAERDRLDVLMDADPDAWWRAVTASASNEAHRTLVRLRLSRVPTAAEMTARRHTHPATQLHPSPGWPAIAIPGRPGHYLTWHGDEHQEEAA
ncbi:hypothetical protein [Streptomyces lydicus]|uniref:DUF2742 domain-containing protein n=1 Tax=Streptomyces lydicus TaxID=47763 RepID=A0A1D7VVM2_9ACTN|nr:hypothetical protein [Streptomyces lydicus]AOP50744.1 hypothetical protein SL103_34895 [Streptomyces lydicus]